MSYDLFVFDPDVALTDRNEFLSWYRQITRWDDKFDFDVRDSMSGNHLAFYKGLTAKYPDMNSPDVHEKLQFTPQEESGFLPNC